MVTTEPAAKQLRAVQGLKASLRALVGALEPDAVFVFDAPALWSELGEVARLAQAGMMLLARRVEDACSWRGAGAGKRRSSPKCLALVRVDHAALRRGAVEGDEVCEIAGLGPVPVSVARGLLGESVLKLVVTKGVDVANVTHLGRSVTVAQQVALWWRSPSCTAEGCTRTRRIENDHRYEWVKTRRTRLDETDPLCGHHHDLKSYDNGALVRGTGSRPMVPPDDPRHPNTRPPPGA